EVQSMLEGKWTVGGGVGGAPDYEGSDDYEAVPLFVARWARDDGVFVEALPNDDIGGYGVRLNMIGDSPLILGPIINYRRRRNDVSDNSVDQLNSVGTSWELGGFIGFNWEGWNIIAQVVHDAADGHDGGLISLGGGYSSRLKGNWSKWNWGVRASTAWASDNYMESYFSVSSSEASSTGLNRFDAESGFKDAGLDLSLGRQFYDKWLVTGSFSYKRLLNDAKDSPVTDDAGSADQFSGGLLISYTF
ncbi:MAG: MipA/OmpV family protein, partial [Nitrospirota bacterium]|nr:MipA/OmpV family protein [Nitrospirota bacterium]